MKKKLLALVLVVVLAITSIIGGTLAYQTDTEDAVNVMTLGDVSIEQTEKDRYDNDFVTQPLYPAVGELALNADGYWDNANVIDKIVTVTNDGDRDAYVRTVIAIEIGNPSVEEYIKINWADNLNMTDVGNVTIEGAQYALYVVNLGLMTPGQSAVTLEQVALDYTADNEQVDALGKDYKILVVSQAIQAEMGEMTPEAALNEGFGVITTTSHPWANGISGEAWDGTADSEALENVTDEEAKTVEISTASSWLLSPRLSTMVLTATMAIPSS